MSFRPAPTLGGLTPAPVGQIDYRLARNAVVREFHRGRLSRTDVCDAHPELLRVARHLGQPTSEDCPICASSQVVRVWFAFGPRLPAGGRCVTSQAQLAKLAAGASQVACYVVEVCTSCSWNHLAKMEVLGGRAEARAEP